MQLEEIKKRAEEIVKHYKFGVIRMCPTPFEKSAMWAADTILELVSEVEALTNPSDGRCMEIGNLRQHVQKLTAANKIMLSFVRKSHHIDGCAHRYGKDCDCGKFKIEAEECMK